MSVQHPAVHGPVTLANCADEPIRLPGSVQQHGFYLVVDHSETRVVVASENAATYLGVPQRLLLGTPLATLLPREIVQALEHFRSGSQPEQVTNYLGSFLIKGELFSVVTHCLGSRRVLELEKQEKLVGAEMMNGVITNFVGLLSKLRNSAELCDAVTKQVAELTGFDRVMLYQFDETGAGTVLAEVNNGNLPSYLGLRFPGTDIPQQARELYVLNTVRIILDANYEPSHLLSIDGEDARTIDLSLATLRSVSPIHLQYMRNMGTLSSMSLSIVVDGKLWGLISGHHAKPHHVPYLIRSACDLLSKLAGTQLSSYQTSERLSRAVELHRVQRGLLTQIAADQNYIATLEREADTLKRVTDADSVVLWLGDHYVDLGRTPEQQDLVRIVEWLDGRDELVFATSSLRNELPWADEIREIASGMIAVRISDINSRYLIWFRREVIETVKWAGADSGETDKRKLLTPRRSFEVWKETVRGQSRKWSDVEVQSATGFRSALVTVSLRAAEEKAMLNEARFQQLTQTLPTLIFTTDGEGELVYTNNRWREAGLKTTGMWFEHGNVHEDDVARCRVAWKHALATGAEMKEEVRLHQNGHTCWNFIHAVPFRVRGLEFAGWVGSCVDLTEQRERESKMRMTEKLALSGRMTSVIAHEINNPLASITNLMYLLRLETTDSEAAGEYISMAENELHRISGITKQTLRWNRENSDTPEPIAMQDVADDIERLMQGKIRNRQVRLHIDVEDTTVFGSRGQIRQVIANLIANAVEATRVGGNAWFTARNEGDEAVIQVKDDGIGMDDGIKQQLFKPFYTTKGDLGNGLGLYISQEVVEKHGGTIHVQSEVNKGTVVTVRLPSVTEVANA